MSSFTVPTAYRRYVEHTMALLMATVARDADLRQDDDPRVRALAPVPDQYVDQIKDGRTVIVVTPQSGVMIDPPPVYRTRALGGASYPDNGEGAE